MLRMRTAVIALAGLSFFAVAPAPAVAADWTRFRGPNGSGVCADDAAFPTTWSDSENVKWRLELPGPGSSSPIVVGDKVFVTCWTGYGVDPDNAGDQKNLKRHLLCIDRTSGKIQWNQAIEAALPEDYYEGMFAEHGYASHTPTSDGERVYAFFGKSGVFAFDLTGKQLWSAKVGDGLDPSQWGSAASPVLHKNLLIVPAAAESESLIALDSQTGKEVWKQQAAGFVGTWSTPVFVDSKEGKTDLVMGVPGELWGFNPETGKLRWYCTTSESNSMCASAVAGDGVAYLFGDRGGAFAVRAGGANDVTKSHLLWSEGARARIGTPVLYENRLYWFGQGVANCIDASTGKEIFQGRLGAAGGSDDAARPPAGGLAGRPAAPPGGGQRPRRGPGGPPAGGFGGPGFGGPGFGGGPGGGFGGGGGFGRSQDYSSPIVAGGNVYFISRSGVGYVIKAGDKLEVLARNRFESDQSDFSATPAASAGELFIRSSKVLYCLADGER